ncbi:MAG: HDIG domain-containing protein [Bacteroidales bacterium]|nr:HDIG domain-containing protein [Bacteroidales bacterium]
MKIFSQKIKNNIKRTMLFSMFAVSSAIVVYMLPRERKFDREYSKGSPWAHENLTANFSFSIYKTDTELAKERDSVLKNHVPYFKFDAYVFDEKLKAFESDFNRKWVSYSLREFNIAGEEAYFKDVKYYQLTQLQKKYLDYCYKLLERAYLKGIIRERIATGFDLTRNSVIKLLKGNIAEEVSIDSVYTMKSAYQYITSTVESKVSGDNSRYIKNYADFFNDIDFNRYLVDNVVYNDEKTKLERDDMLKSISLTKGKIQEGELIVSKGVIITQEIYQVLESYKREYASQLGNVSTFLAWAGRIILTLITFFVVYMFLYNFRREILDSLLKTSFILFMMVLMIVVASAASSFDQRFYYVVPFTILPIIIRTFYDERVALFIHMTTILLAGFMATNSYDFVFLNIIAGMVSIFSLTNLYHRARFFLAALFVVIAYSLTYFGMSVVKEGSFSLMDWSNYKYFAINGVLIMLSFLLIYIFEKTFGFLSDTTLMELSDTNQPLLRKLAESAPATFQHSMQVANLAEEAIRHIGGNPLLVRTGALYHDIGKITDPSYFTENQGGGPNPHSEKDLKESAKIIIGHVDKGMELAKKYKLPAPIASFIETHHGTSLAKYFYKTYQSKHSNEPVEAKDFQYPGPKPVTKETAVLMMADSVEAASRSLESYSSQKIDDLVETIINSQIDDGQFEETDITFRDIKKVKEVFKTRLKNIYHARIAYPK